MELGHSQLHKSTNIMVSLTVGDGPWESLRGWVWSWWWSLCLWSLSPHGVTVKFRAIVRAWKEELVFWDISKMSGIFSTSKIVQALAHNIIFSSSHCDVRIQFLDAVDQNMTNTLYFLSLSECINGSGKPEIVCVYLASCLHATSCN